MDNRDEPSKNLSGHVDAMPVTADSVTGSSTASKQSENLVEREAEERIAKLRLEQLILKQQVSPLGRALEWLKAATAPVALIALFWTVIAGLDQMKQSRKAAVDDRFDKTIARIASQDAYARITGIAGLRPFLSGSPATSFSLISHYTRELDAVSYLVTALAVEDDPVLRDAILDELSRLRADGVSSATIDTGLRIALERNRKLATSVDIGNDDLNTLPASDPRLARLRATALAVVAFVRQGARVDDMTDLYCVECDFSGSNIDLSRTTFDRAILREADFSDANLSNSSFDGANISAARFVRSKMHSTHLTDAYHVTEHRGRLLVSALQKHPGELAPADFTCADLDHAVFSHQILFGTYENYTPDHATSWSPTFDNADLMDADLTDIRMFVVFGLPKSISERQLIDPEGHVPEQLLPFTLADGWTLNNDRLPPPPPDTHEDRIDLRNRDYWMAMDLGPGWSIKNDGGKFRNSLRSIAEQIKLARNLGTAKLPPGLKAYLHQIPASSDKPTSCTN